ncbi:MAG: hypothetical protein ACYDB5_05580 [bacterium]
MNLNIDIYTDIPREHNKQADRLANIAIDSNIPELINKQIKYNVK